MLASADPQACHFHTRLLPLNIFRWGFQSLISDTCRIHEKFLLLEVVVLLALALQMEFLPSRSLGMATYSSCTISQPEQEQ